MAVWVLTSLLLAAVLVAGSFRGLVALQQQVERAWEELDRQLQRRKPEHRLAPAKMRDRAFEDRRPERARHIGAAGDQRQRRSAPPLEPLADIDIKRCVDAGNAKKPDEQPVSDMQLPEWPLGRLKTS